MARLRPTPLRLSVAAAGTAGLLVIGGLAATASSQSRGALLKQLERPAVPAAASAAVPDATSVGTIVSATPMPIGHYRLRMAVTPNRAAARNRFAITVTERGHPVAGDTVTVTFSMPSMNMWQALTTQLEPVGNGIYAATEPVLGMAGSWQLSVRVTRPGEAPVIAVLADRIGA